MSSGLCKIAANRMLTSAADLCLILSFCGITLCQAFHVLQICLQISFLTPHMHISAPFRNLFRPLIGHLRPPNLSLLTHVSIRGDQTLGAKSKLETLSFISARHFLLQRVNHFLHQGGNVELSRRAVYHASYIRVIHGSIACLT